MGSLSRLILFVRDGRVHSIHLLKELPDYREGRLNEQQER